MKLTNKEGRAFLKTGKLPDRLKWMWDRPKKKNKFGAVKYEYNGRIYDSTGEGKYSQYVLDVKLKAGEIKKVEYQYRIELKVDGEHICYYDIDFKVTHNDNSIEFIEYKGKPTSTWRIKWKMTIATLHNMYPDAKLTLVMHSTQEHIKIF